MVVRVAPMSPCQLDKCTARHSSQLYHEGLCVCLCVLIFKDSFLY